MSHNTLQCCRFSPFTINVTCVFSNIWINSIHALFNLQGQYTHHASHSPYATKPHKRDRPFFFDNIGNYVTAIWLIKTPRAKFVSISNNIEAFFNGFQIHNIHNIHLNWFILFMVCCIKPETISLTSEHVLCDSIQEIKRFLDLWQMLKPNPYNTFEVLFNILNFFLYIYILYNFIKPF